MNKRYALQFLTLALLYFLSGALGLFYTQESVFVTLIWPPAGIALGLLLRWRLDLWPAILLAELCIAFFVSDLPFPLGTGIGLTNTLVPLFTAHLLQRQKFSSMFERSRDLFLFLFVGVGLTSALSAFAGTAQLYLLDKIALPDLPRDWLMWWLGDAAGILLLALPILAIARSTVRPLTRGFSGLATALLLILAVEIFIVNYFNFADGLLVLPMLLVVWIAMTTNLQVSSLAILLFTIIASAGTLSGHGVFTDLKYTQEAHWVYITSLAIASAVIASISIETRRNLDQKHYALRAAGIGTWDLRLPSHHVYFNNTWATMLGRKVRQLDESMSTFRELVHPDDYLQMMGALTSYIKGDSESYYATFRMRHANGEWRWIEAHGEVTDRNFNGHPTRICGTHQDITERKVLEDDLALNLIRLNQAQEIAQLGHWTSNMATGELWWSPIIYQMFGLDPDKVTPSVKLFNQLIHRDDFDSVLSSEAKAIESGEHDVEHRIVRPDGSVRWVHELASLERDEDGQPFRMVGTVQDITDYKELELKLRRQALIDELTQVPNRRYMMQQLAHEWTRYQRYPEQTSSFVMVDIDFFKQLNDTYGHGFGDDVLQAVAGRLHGLLRDVDVFARMGGEEFALLLPQTGAKDAMLVAEKLRAAIASLDLLAPGAAQPDVEVTASFGVAEFNAIFDNEDDVMVAADNALYKAKESGRNRVEQYTPPVSEH
ncbi:PAS domain S-box-containing protein/diguanylate cyclase (GGDEF) domain-containing protein [Pseudidiomarina planktonica]|uniref:diguanylate cyclase n=1 Tax=Pseudidiomarina planktonica TaxID=1323738 RepID=A0A1Y6E6W5_9GAMM|nr:sensor domain-containing diguanylate cyclase [Pseudidiomarina planktonica]RUO66374.1 sensor domain-containing diguanylate cyclase [Pseudidiomarina planktonica]SMQ58465.1 PAS domain S-box-containing protein/diguanylate cyclase (GGDEF) domain-containing protein [Pseudidiomarina planktonica]